MFGREGSHRFSDLTDGYDISAQLIDHALEAKFVENSPNLRDLPRHGQTFAAALTRTVWISEEPECRSGMHAAAHARIMTAKKEGERLMLLPLIEPHSLFGVISRCLWIADPEGGCAHCVMCLEQECPIIHSVRHREKLLSN